MTNKPPSRIVEVSLPRDPKPEFKQLGGSDIDEFNLSLADQTLNALWLAHTDDKQHQKQSLAACAVLIGAKLRDELEGMLVSQMIACHAASMECHRRAMLPNQTVEGRQMSLGAASKLSRTYATLLEALNRHRGKGRQVIRVERVTVEAGGQAIVGAVTQGGGGDHNISEDQARAPRRIAHEPEPALRCPDPPGQPMPVTGGQGQETVPDARRRSRQRRTAR
jgi:hypothetical protein